MEITSSLKKEKAFKTKCLVMLSLLVAFWPVIRWYMLRLNDGGDEPYGLLALLSGLMIIFKRRNTKNRSRLNITLSIISILLIFYSLIYHYSPPIVRAFIALIILSYSGQRFFIGKKIELSIVALFILSLPLLSSLQFYCGYPLRAISAYLAASIVTLTGYHTIAEGTLLMWAGEIISVDAPCSGVKMLWSGLFANFLLAAILRKNNLFTWLSYWFASATIFTTNTLRITILFYTESKIIILPSWFHEFIGLISFSTALIIIFLFHLYDFSQWRNT